MKLLKIITYTILVCIINASTGQNIKYSSLSFENPIRQVNHYLGNDRTLMLEILLNEIQVDSLNSVINPKSLKIDKVIGKIEWTDNRSKPEYISFDCSTSQINPYKLTGIFQAIDNNGNPTVIKSDNWRSIQSLAISYQIKDKSSKLPLIDIYPTIQDRNTPLHYNVSTDDINAYFKGNKSTFKVKISPATKFEITHLYLKKDNLNIPNNNSNLPLTSNSNGVCEVNFDGGIQLTEGRWLLSGNIKFTNNLRLIENQPFESQLGLLPEKEIKIKNKDHLSIDARGSKSLKLNIPTTAVSNEKIQIVYFPDYILNQYNIAASQINNNDGDLTITLDNINNLPKDEVIYYQIRDEKNVPIDKQYYKITNKKAILTNFLFDISNQSNNIIEFDLPNWVDPSELSLNFYPGNFNINGDAITKKEKIKGLKSFQCSIDQKNVPILYTNYKQDTLITGTISVTYKKDTLYQTTVKYINQKLISEKLIELAQLTSQKQKKKKDIEERKKNIDQTLETLFDIAAKAGISKPDNETKSKLKTNLENGNKESGVSQAMITLSKVGQWVVKYGPAIIPLIL